MTRQSGVTLVEMLVAIALGSAVALLITNMYITSSRTYTDQNRIIDAQRGGRISLEVLSRDLRHAGLDPLRTANAGFEVADADRVRVTMDLNLDGDVADVGEQITFRRFGDALQKGTGNVGVESWRTLAGNLSTFRVDYFGESNAAIA
ncbi:MAG: prepilin-type N-terminal cleavage/methylation domain-containing protein, partial [Desulfuromonadales bacterium]|nr:prepilin-type N-terminal cleavage/methylation domain-containing protein [Desulfuromonadales bacterium]